MGHVFFGHHFEDEHIKRLFTIVVAPYIRSGPPFGGSRNVRGLVGHFRNDCKASSFSKLWTFNDGRG